MRVTTVDDAIRQVAEQWPDALALADAPNREAFFAGEPLRLTWREVDRAVDNLAVALTAIGAGPHVAVAVQLPNVVELVLTILACGRIGATAVPFPIQHRRHELDYGLRASSARIIVTGTRPDRPDQLDTVSAVVDDLDTPVHIATFGSAIVDTGTALTVDTTEAAASQGVPAGPDEVLTICWTSGTTGTPKGVPRTPSMWLASGYFQVDELDLLHDDRILCPFPLVNMAGIGGMLVPWAIVGAVLFLHQPLDLPVFLGQLTSEEITYTVAPPALLNMLLLDDSILAGVDLSHLRKITSGAAPLDPWMVQGWDELGVEIVNAFGSNEGAALLSTATSVPDPKLRARYFPRPSAEGIEVRLVDPDSEDDINETGRPGELRFRGPTVFGGYLDASGAEFDDAGFFRTGDIFEWADTSSDPWLLRFVDRAKDIIIRGGMKISAAELEGLIAAHDSVADCAAIGYRDASLGERVGIFVAPAGDHEPSLETIVAHLRNMGIASYKLPERLEIVDALPRNALGKIAKNDLRDRWRTTEENS
jgi:acyl-CoA synthetase (AMP-forming)/AMP-acid ligase II